MDRAGQRSAIADNQLENLPKFFGVNDECEDGGPNQRMRNDFAKNVASENAHEAKPLTGV